MGRTAGCVEPVFRLSAKIVLECKNDETLCSTRRVFAATVSGSGVRYGPYMLALGEGLEG
jgi:hypothetical protein